MTTGLLRGVRYVKDNRLLPRGFDKATAAADIAVQGGALPDPDFVAGSDRVRYVVAIAGAPRPVKVTANLWYQSIGYRWAHNLKDYRAAETQRFAKYYEETADTSAILVASATAELTRVPPGTTPGSQTTR